MLSKEQLNFYSENGYLLLDEVFSPEEIEECSLAYDNLFKAKQSNSDLEAKWKGSYTNDASTVINLLQSQ